MALTIPDQGEGENDVQSVLCQSTVDAVAAGFNRTGVVSGCAVTAQGSPNMTVAVAAGTVVLAGALATVTSGNVTIGTADATNPRLDLIVSDGSGTKSVIAGTAAAAPKEATLDTTTYVLLAQVYVPASATTITTARITDRRVLYSVQSAGAKIAETILSGTAASITFSSIPATYRTLMVALSGRSDNASAPTLQMQYNGDTASHYQWNNTFSAVATPGNTNSTSDTSMRCGRVPGTNGTANFMSQFYTFIHNYAGTTFYKNHGGKTSHMETASSMSVEDCSGLWLSTAAITSVLLKPSAGNFIAGTIATLYGLS